MQYQSNDVPLQMVDMSSSGTPALQVTLTVTQLNNSSVLLEWTCNGVADGFVPSRKDADGVFQSMLSVGMLSAQTRSFLDDGSSALAAPSVPNLYTYHVVAYTS
jgi:hypothetical protein